MTSPDIAAASRPLPGWRVEFGAQLADRIRLPSWLGGRRTVSAIHYGDVLHQRLGE